MRRYVPLLVVLALLVTAGCVEEYPPETNITPVQAVTSAVPSHTPGQTAPPPAEMAYLSGIQCATGDKSEDTYHCNGNIRIRGGAHDEVQVIARYPDNNVFRSNIVSLGGGEPVSKPFILFPDIKYQGQNPSYFVKMDRIVYPVNGGVAWSNLPPVYPPVD